MWRRLAIVVPWLHLQRLPEYCCWFRMEVWVSETASHFKNHIMAALKKSVGVDRRFSIANSPWSNGTCERMMREVVRTLKATFQEERRNI